MPLEATGDLEQIWPKETPKKQLQQELRIRLFQGCPPGLAARFAARAHDYAHDYGYCEHAWLTGAVVLTKDNQRIRAEFVQADVPCLTFAVRGEMLGKDTLSLFQAAIDFIKKETSERLEGLRYTLEFVFVCPECASGEL